MSKYASKADYWEAEALRYCGNADYWKERARAAEQDDTRYRWLRENYAMLMCNSGNGTYSVTFQPVLRSRGFTSEQLDAAIDAAMTAAATPAGRPPPGR